MNMDPFGPLPPRHRFILCFDGTGNKFAGDESDTNLLKIYRMLDRTKSHQYHYYQPGIGTYVNADNLDSDPNLFQRFKASCRKAADAALGSSFDKHVLGGYRFLMHHYTPGDEIHMFGFSRGAYTARFLSEMLDHIGLLQPGNEELIAFAWRKFSRWQLRRRSDDDEETRRLFEYMKAFRETFSWPVEPVRFMGLFDTVNSVPMFEGPWMGRSQFPYSSRSKAKVVRHAVAINERRAKFRQDLVSQGRPRGFERTFSSRLWHEEEALNGECERLLNGNDDDDDEEEEEEDRGQKSGDSSSEDDETTYRASRGRSSTRSSLRLWTDSSIVKTPCQSTLTDQIFMPLSMPTPEQTFPQRQDIQEVWFAGEHADVGGGWGVDSNDPWPLSHIPLVWMVKEAQAAGVEFDPVKLKRFDCQESVDDHKRSKRPGHGFHEVLHETMARGIVHDSLSYGGGLSRFSTFIWRLMEFLPFRRMDLRPDGSWEPISWPLPRGEVRDIPDDAQIHISVIQRMERDPTYRPGNVIVGGGGRGVKRAPEEYGIGEWKPFRHEGDPVRATFVRKRPSTFCDDGNV
ncbi:T6SS phospholipase effector Tle1-like catalytic domain-containing protein [Aspergillus candidus]|uniref:T6SS Phospholipase effector Tle1-like catalytic domain-containing protein n=1 Tax=Aspergillus candidus TaxID=41067 RepID=A0A2I2F8F5_ASPCN|nr:hypothetical protein BDW47DRAFT_132509 [Aspergillus candidus]PLB36910.1 hypothetical protein BDW47DRAFT_132509 [Aspergillus candidus]